MLVKKPCQIACVRFRTRCSVRVLWRCVHPIPFLPDLAEVPDGKVQAGAPSFELVTKVALLLVVSPAYGPLGFRVLGFGFRV